MSQPQEVKKKSGFLLNILIIGAFVAILAAIALPDYMTFNIKAYQAEARRNLSLIHKAQMKYHSDHNEYFMGPGCFEKLNIEFGYPSKRYSFYCGTEILAPQEPANNLRLCDHPDPPEPTDEVFFIMAVGNVDQDSKCDIWIINEAGVDENIVNDVSFFQE
jgi:Tfp pilus assembly protein PilE